MDEVKARTDKDADQGEEEEEEVALIAPPTDADERLQLPLHPLCLELAVTPTLRRVETRRRHRLHRRRQRRYRR